ncbi:MAG: efflux RND transporter permease subunit [Merismopedia sp. SIO2A8]|nr:efflux RND transporter permease subunit [Symploca sp. SIO2B6]NET48816.1 efflux RND transporter permease subunit [Merismopedia sp. SIO2A8]
MFVQYFIKRPVFTIVCALITLLIGGICIPLLPIAQYPDIAPKQVRVTANYTGADARTVEDTVTTILERELNGIEGLRYMSSSSSNSGSSAITLTLDATRDPDIAAVDIQNRVAVAEPRLPIPVTRTGISVRKQSSSILLGFGLYSDSGEFDNIFLSNYADLYIVDALRRIDGVGNVRIFGERKYAMRLWLDPTRLATRDLTTQDVVDALNEQNIQVGVGRIGQQPASADQEYQLDLRAISRFETIQDFENLVLKTGDDGTLVRLKDVGRAELGAEDYNSFLRFQGYNSVGLGIYQIPGSNALTVAREVKAEMARLSETFPEGMAYDIGFDTTDFVEQSLVKVAWTLVQAVGLVIVVIFIFLQDWRTTIIPAVTIPISLLGTFAFVKLFDFSINSLTLFGLTLATGMVVDDAIVVVEDIAAKIQRRGLSPMQASIEAMQELSGAVIATSLVLMAVFIPVAFFPGTTGALYRQFALTIAFAIAVSTFNALTLTPAISAFLLRPQAPAPRWLQPLFTLVNRSQAGLHHGYEAILGQLNHLKYLILGVFALLLIATVWIYQTVPSAFLPEEDQGYFITILRGPPGVALNYTDRAMKEVEDIYADIPEIRATFAVGGFGFSGSSANSAVIFSPLIPWSERPSPDQSARAVVDRVQGELAQLTDVQAFAVNPPALRGLGNFGGFQYQLQDQRGTLTLDQLVEVRDQLIAVANQQPDIGAAFSTYAANAPQLEIEVNRDRANALQVDIDDVFQTLQTYLGSRYVNDFNLDRRTYRVYVQADQAFRDNPEDINRLYVRSQLGEMISLGNLVTLTPTTGAQIINHYNGARSIEITGQAAPGASSGRAIATMDQVSAATLPPGVGYEWAGLSLEEVESGGQAPIIFTLGLILVFLVLAALYESFADPLIIMLVVPLAIMGALIAQDLRGLPNDVYCQIGLVMLIGLASKNSILIVEFANQLRAEGYPIVQAALEAAKQRLRPILMTAISTLSSIFPLVVATGAGSGSRQSLGTAVFGGMLTATVLSLFVVPVMYIVLKSLVHQITGGRPSSANLPSPQWVSEQYTEEQHTKGQHTDKDAQEEDMLV